MPPAISLLCICWGGGRVTGGEGNFSRLPRSNVTLPTLMNLSTIFMVKVSLMLLIRLDDMLYSYGLRSAAPALTPEVLLAVKERLTALDQAVTAACQEESRSPRDVAIIKGLLADVWYCWRDMEAGERIGVVTIVQLIERLAKKSKCRDVMGQVFAVKATLAELAPQGVV